MPLRYNGNVRRAGGVLVVVVILLGVPACSGSSSGSHCLPPLPRATPTKVSVGETITVTTDPADCDLNYPKDKQYVVTFGHSGSERQLATQDVRVKPDGTFVAHITVPVGIRPGMAWINVAGSPYDRPCQDTGSCVSYTTTVTVG